MEKHHYGHGSKGIDKSIPIGDREATRPSDLYQSRLREIQRHAEEETKRRVNQRGVSEVLRVLKGMSLEDYN